MNQKQIQITLLLLFLWAMQLSSVHAQETTAETTAPAQISADEINLVARELWCPLCSGVRLDSCELKACDQMREQIALQLADGADTDSIKAYFVEQYGPQVLGEPPREGFNWLAWILPFAVLIGGAVFLVVRGREMLSGQSATTEATSTTEMKASTTSSEDRYAKQLDEELKAYE